MKKAQITIFAFIFLSLFLLTNIYAQVENNFSYTSEHQSKCIEGTKTCEMGYAELWTCKADGSYEQVKCPFGCTSINGINKCVDNPNPEIQTSQLSDYSFPLIIGIAIVIGFIILALILRRRK